MLTLSLSLSLTPSSLFLDDGCIHVSCASSRPFSRLFGWGCDSLNQLAGPSRLWFQNTEDFDATSVRTPVEAFPMGKLMSTGALARTKQGHISY